MTIEKIIGLLSRKIANLSLLKTAAEAIGDIDRVAELDSEIAETQASLDLLLAVS
jgi:hypothetical protein